MSTYISHAGHCYIYLSRSREQYGQSVMITSIASESASVSIILIAFCTVQLLCNIIPDARGTNTHSCTISTANNDVPVTLSRHLFSCPFQQLPIIAGYKHCTWHFPVIFLFLFHQGQWGIFQVQKPCCCDEGSNADSMQWCWQWAYIFNATEFWAGMKTGTISDLMVQKVKMQASGIKYFQSNFTKDVM